MKKGSKECWQNWCCTNLSLKCIVMNENEHSVSAISDRQLVLIKLTTAEVFCFGQVRVKQTKTVALKTGSKLKVQHRLGHWFGLLSTHQLSNVLTHSHSTHLSDGLSVFALRFLFFSFFFVVFFARCPLSFSFASSSAHLHTAPSFWWLHRLIFSYFFLSTSVFEEHLRITSRPNSPIKGAKFESISSVSV